MELMSTRQPRCRFSLHRLSRSQWRTRIRTHQLLCVRRPHAPHHSLAEPGQRIHRYHLYIRAHTIRWHLKQSSNSYRHTLTGILLQAQEYAPTSTSAHAPPFAHGLLAQSSVFVSHELPSNPARQLHVNWATPSKHAAPCWHGKTPHSSISSLQFSPLHPTSHAQLYPYMRSVHVASC